MASEDNGNVGLLKPTSSSNEDLSEYTDADESISAPTEFLAEVCFFFGLFYFWNTFHLHVFTLLSWFTSRHRLSSPIHHSLSILRIAATYPTFSSEVRFNCQTHVEFIRGKFFLLLIIMPTLRLLLNKIHLELNKALINQLPFERLKRFY